MFEFETSMSRPTAYELHRRARREQSEAVNALARSAMRKLAQSVRTLVGNGIRLARTLAAERRLRRDMRVLHALEDRALRDMGLTRGEINRVVRHGRPRSHTVEATRRERGPSGGEPRRLARVYAGARGR
jgi:uncharacterized protein YjiS (DUF1127 family)